MATIFFSHGDKGGVGKSMVSALLVDYLLARGQRVGIVEGDKSIPDLYPRYADQLPAAAINLNRYDEPERVVIDFASAVDAMGDIDAVVVNTPASTGQTLDQIGEVLVTALAEYGHQVVVFYSVGATKAAITAIEQSASQGLIQAAGGCVVAYNDFLGPREQYAYVQSGQADQHGFPSVEIPAIKPADLAQKLADSEQALADTIHGLTIIERTLVDKNFRWPAYAAFDRVLPDVAHSDEAAADE